MKLAVSMGVPAEQDGIEKAVFRLKVEAGKNSQPSEEQQVRP